ncbi:MAG: DUF3352 domain-containing protein [Bacteroidales bacterium]
MLQRTHLYRLLALIATTAVLFTSCRQEAGRAVENPALDLVPTDAVLILESDSLAPLIGRLNRIAPLAGLLPQAGPLGGEPLLLRPGVVSVHQTFRNSYQYLLILVTNDRSNASALQRMVERISGRTGRWTERKYSGQLIHRVDFEKGAPTPSLSLSVLDRFVVLSPSPILVENAIRLQGQPPLKERIPAVGRLAWLTGQQDGSRILVNLKAFPALVGSGLNAKSAEPFLRFNRYGEWAGLNLTLYEQMLLLKGVALPGDTVSSYLNIFAGQKPVPMSTSRQLPAGTTAFYSVGIDQPATYLKALSDYLGGTPAGVARQRIMARTEKLIKGSLEEAFQEIGLSELTLAWIPVDSAGPYRPIVVAAVRNRSKLQARLEEWSPKSESTHSKEDTTSGLTLSRPMPIEELPRMLGGGWFDRVKGSWYAISGNLLILADEPGLVDRFLQQQSLNQLMDTDPMFLTLTGQFPVRSNLTGYLVPARSQPMLREMMNKNLARSLGANNALFEKTGAISFQANSRDGVLNHDLTVWFGPPPIVTGTER